MTLDALETAVFGYKKESVFRFITEVEQGFSVKLQEQEQRARETEAQLQARIRQLEQECAALQERLARQQTGQAGLTGLLSDAEQMAELVQAQAAARERAVRHMLEEDRAARQQVLDRYLAQLRAACAPQEQADGPAVEGPEAGPDAQQPVLEQAEMAAAADEAEQAEAAPEPRPGQAGPADAEQTPPAADGTRSVRVGGTADVYQVDSERNMSLFRRRVYPAD